VPDARDEEVPRYANRPLPAQRHLPGRTPRPRTAAAPPAGVRFAAATWWLCEDFRHGVDLWNRRYFWEAHEAWEEPWRAAGRDTPPGRLLQGFILLAAAAVKHEVGASGPARRLAARAARCLRQARDASPHVDAHAFAAAVEHWLSGARPDPPLLRLDAPQARTGATRSR
jgi:hypothetical protein